MKNSYEWIVPVLIVIGIFGILVFAATLQDKPFKNIESEKTTASNSEFETKTIIIDGCEYLAFKDSHGSLIITHKGNCNNPIHVYRTEK